MFIEIENLKKTYGSRTVVSIGHLTIQKGETVGVVGNNGAGKTTLFRMILDLVKPDDGEVLSKGVPVANSDHWKDYTASYLDEGFLIEYLTPEEYFYFIGSLHKKNKADVQEYLSLFHEFFNEEVLQTGKYIRDLSKGNQNKVGITSALMQNPELLVLDEPFANLDPTTQIRLKTLLRDLNRKNNITFLISSHDLNHITDVCDRIILLEKGHIVQDIQTTKYTLQDLHRYFSEKTKTEKTELPDSQTSFSEDK